MHSQTISSEFIWRRVHSLMGFWLVIYLCEHMLVNSQVALWIEDQGHVFIRMANGLESIPFLPVAEILFLGIPIGIHGVWGIYPIFQAKTNSKFSNGSKPSLQYGRNRAFTWQRLSSWILLFGILGHVLQMRFLDQPKKIHLEGRLYYAVCLEDDPDLMKLTHRVQANIFSKEQAISNGFSHLKKNEVAVFADTPGTVMLLKVRDTFKSPLMVILYSIFVMAAAFHAFNGLWTFLITWGMILSYRSQKAALPLIWIGFGIILFFGFAAIYGSYWLS